ncbi:MAG: homoserine kinase [Acidobacteria bacterium]|nr:homoserine kinase [Acidobacteriota bacterium]
MGRVLSGDRDDVTDCSAPLARVQRNPHGVRIHDRSDRVGGGPGRVVVDAVGLSGPPRALSAAVQITIDAPRAQDTGTIIVVSSEASITAFAPASVSNVACGFDVLGFAISGLGDRVTARRTRASGVRMSRITGDEGRLPHDARRNTASVAAAALIEGRQTPAGVEIVLEKGLPLASGLGSSAASAVAAVVAVDALFGLGAPLEELLRCAVEGERVACGAAHADNAAPSLYGGFVLVRSTRPIDIVRLPVPRELACAVLCPSLEVETKAARAVLGDSVPLAAAVAQWANVGALVAGLHRDDYDLIGRALQDAVAEPHRARLVPGFADAKRAALDAGALGCSLSGSGPAMFALCRGSDRASIVGAAMREAFAASTGVTARAVIASLPAPGAHVEPAESRV